MIKASAELLAALGAENETGFSAALLGRLNADSAKISGLETKLAEYESRFAAVETAGESTTQTLNSIKSQVEAIEILDRSELLEAAKDAGSLAGAVVLGKAGLVAVDAHVVTDGAEQSAAATLQEHLDAGRYAEAFKLDSAAQSEFPTAESYAAYNRLEAQGRVKISSRNR